jgi:hypothetical protein
VKVVSLVLGVVVLAVGSASAQTAHNYTYLVDGRSCPAPVYEVVDAQSRLLTTAEFLAQGAGADPGWDAGRVALWNALIGLIVADEISSAREQNPRHPTFSQVVTKEFPPQVTLPFFVWLLFHFAQMYFGH